MTTEHGAGAPVQILPVEGLPDFRPGDDLASALAAAAPWLRDRDVVVVTSKVVSKCEGRLVPAPEDPEERDALRRKLIDDEAVRVLARKGRTLITENAYGLVQAAAGVDGSNIGSAELALLPIDPDASAASLRAGVAERLGVDVAVVITDTMGRAWRNGQTDVAIGAAGLQVLHGYAGSTDPHGNELVVTEIAVADEWTNAQWFTYETAPGYRINRHVEPGWLEPKRIFSPGWTLGMEWPLIHRGWVYYGQSAVMGADVYDLGNVDRWYNYNQEHGSPYGISAGAGRACWGAEGRAGCCPVSIASCACLACWRRMIRTTMREIRSRPPRMPVTRPQKRRFS